MFTSEAGDIASQDWKRDTDMHSWRQIWQVFGTGVFSLIILAGATAWAVDSRVLSVHRDWTAYIFEENGRPVCYMASQPTKAEGNYTRRGAIFARITHRPAENSRNVFSYVAGYTYRPDSEVTVRIGSRTFTLFTHDDTAWANTEADDEALAQAVKAGNEMIVIGTSSRGTRTVDTFSLRGSTAAWNTMSQACGVS